MSYGRSLNAWQVWNEAPHFGNAMVGSMLYQAASLQLHHPPPHRDALRKWLRHG